MLSLKNLSRGLGLSVVMVGLLVAFSLAVAGGASVDKNPALSPSRVSAPASLDCAQPSPAPEAPLFQAPDGGSCSADPTATAIPDWLRFGGRTCRCSCGYPCKTDADCGGGIGSCRAGISCC
jgi:hypothetical protein